MSSIKTLGIGFALMGLLLSPAYAEERELSLKEALDNGYKSHPSLAQAKASYDASQAKVKESLASWMPSLTGSFGYQYVGSNPVDTAQTKLMGQPSGWIKNNSFNESLVLNQTIYDFGRTTGGYDAAREAAKASKADIAATRETVSLSVVQSYYALLATQENLTAVDEIKAQMAKHLEQARAQAEKGTRTRIDVTRAESDMANAELSVLKARNAVLTARLGLNNAMGRFDLGDYKAATSKSELEWPTESNEALVREAQNARPDILSLRAKLKAVQAQRQTAIGGFLPMLSASAGYSASGKKINEQGQNLFIGANLSWNFLGALTAMHVLNENKANVAVLKAGLQTAENGVRVEVESALVAAKEAREKITPSEALLKSAKETLELAEARYQAGLGTIVDVTDAEAQYAQARVGLIQAQFDLQTAGAKLYKALGRLQNANFGS